MKNVRWIAVLVFAMSLFTLLASCGSDSGTAVTPAPDTQIKEPVPEQQITPEYSEKYTVRAGFLKGPTGIGAAYMMDNAANGECENNYEFTLEADPSAINAAIISGSLDIAAVPTNVAAVLYNKTGGGVQIAAINTMNVLYLLENGDSINNINDLAGKTVYTTGQGANPEYVLSYILRANGLEPGRDVIIEFGDGAEIAAKMAAGDIDICMLPVPNATSVLIKNENVRMALDIGEEWDKVSPDGSKLTQGCIVVRTELENRDEVIARFLRDYEASISFMSDGNNIEKAAALTEQYEIVGSAAIAKKAIPQSGLVFIAGNDEIAAVIDGYYKVLFDADPASIGGVMPDDAIYGAP